MSGFQVELTESEMFQGAMVGVMRQVESHKLGRQQVHGASPVRDQWQRHIEGALGELAVAKFLNIFWTGKGVLRGADVGEYDVRCSNRHTNRLILHKEDPGDRIFWFVTGNNDEFLVHGWITGDEGKQEKYWDDPGTGRPAYFVGPNELHGREEFAIHLAI